MSAEENKAVVRRYFEEIDAKLDASVLDEFVAPDFVDHNPSRWRRDGRFPLCSVP